MHFIAPAKINLYLHMTGKRSDGYHLLDSLVAFLDLADDITFQSANNLMLKLSGPFSHGLCSSKNLVIDAAMLLKKYSSIDRHVHIALKKNIPHGGGLGGGSSDAAITLSALNEIWNLNLTEDQLASIGIKLGSDVPVCLKKQPAYIAGVGEIIQPCSILFHGVVLLVNPRIALPTANVFKAYDGQFKKPLTRQTHINHQELVGLMRATENDLTKSAIGICSAIQEILDELHQTEDHIIARMSGSGSTCFALYETRAAAEAALTKVSARYPSFWYHVTSLRSYG